MAGVATPERDLAAIARAYPDDARFTPLQQRLRHFTIDQHLAWAMRFDRSIASRDQIEALHRGGDERLVVAVGAHSAVR